MKPKKYISKPSESQVNLDRMSYPSSDDIAINLQKQDINPEDISKKFR
jgi:hypothetical protein